MDLARREHSVTMERERHKKGGIESTNNYTI